MWKTRLWLALIAATLTWATEVQATHLEQLDRQQLIQRAQVMLVGQCVDVRSNWNGDRSIIATYATYEVEEPIKGVSGRRRIIVKTLGGTVGHITQALLDGPTFELGERNLLFLIESDEPDTWQILGLRQGKVKVHTDLRTGEEMISAGALVPQDAQDHRPQSPRPSGPLWKMETTPPASSTQFRHRNYQTEPLKHALKEIRQHLEAIQ